MAASLILNAPPMSHALSVEDALVHLALDGDGQYARVEPKLAAAIARAQDFTGRAFVTQEWTLVLDAFSDCIEIPLPPLQSVDEIRYLDAGGVQQVLPEASYRVAKAGAPSRVTPAPGYSWPATYDATEAVEIDFTAGYGDDSLAVPDAIKSAVALILEMLYENDQRTIDRLEKTAETLLWPYRVLKF